MAPTVDERKLRSLMAKKERLFKFIQTVFDLSEKLDDEQNRKKFSNLVGAVSSSREEFSSVLDEVILLRLELDEKFEPNYDVMDTIEEMCGQIRAAEKSLRAEKDGELSQRRNAGDASGSSSSGSPRLPKIELPSFSGDLREWEAFYELFRTLIHENSKLSAMDKLYYLMGCLKGQARNVCAGVTMSAENYEVVWDALIQRYQDTRALANLYIGQILEWRDSREESERGLNSFLERFDSAVKALRNLKLRDLADFMFLNHALSKLNSETVNYFEINRHSASVPQYEELAEFVKMRVKTLATAKSAKVPIKPKPELEQSRLKVPAKAFVVNKGQVKTVICKYCRKSEHLLSECQSFLNLSPRERYLKVKDMNLCYNCFSSEHGVRSCLSSSKCDRCSFKHNKLIHHERNLMSSSNPTETKESGVSLYSTGVKETEEATLVLLGTAKVSVEGPLGCCEGRFLVDNGSQTNLVSHKFCRRIGLEIRKISSSVRGLGGLSQPVRGYTSFRIAAKSKGSVSFSVTALVVDKITEKLPQSKISLPEDSWLRKLPLADRSFGQPGPVEGILGAEIFAAILGLEHIKGGKEGPIAIDTSLGYVVMGKIPVQREIKEQQTFISVLESPTVEDLVKQFWELEAIPESSNNSSGGENCEEDFKRNSFRDETGRFTVALPFRQNPSALGDSRMMARKRFFALEAKFKKHPEIKEGYHKAMEDFINKGHIYPVLKELGVASPSYYIPHHAVYRANSESTPVRIVLDASAPSDNGVSLNSILHTGPKLQKDICGILINFRLFSVALVADIRQMYRQVNIVKAQTRFQRLFWRWSPEDPLGIWELGTLAFGVKSSPYLALRCVKELLQEEEKNYPETVGMIRESLYMDDLVVSVPMVQEAVRVYSESMEVFRKGQFELAKWASNSEELLDMIPEESRAKSKESVTFKSLTMTNILGLKWKPIEDDIVMSFPVPASECSKRSILSSVARCFDPIGLSAPLLLHLKLLVKELWNLKLDWDEEAPEAVQKCWKRINEEWPILQRFVVKRSFGLAWGRSVKLLGFADASKNGYGGVIYLQNEETSDLHLVCAKSRVSPVKNLTIPRLELCAALLLTNLMLYVREAIGSKVRVSEILAFSDSSTVLQWLNSGGSNEVFVRNRVSRIKELLPEMDWNHIAGKDNPADGLSRGLSPLQLVENKLWLQGPPWVKLLRCEWPCIKFVSTAKAEETFTITNAEEVEEHPLLRLLTRKSSWSEILRITVWVLRFLNLIPKREGIAVSDLQEAERTLIILVQKKHFAEDLRALQEGKEPSNRLRNLRPFIHHGALRVGGRLSNAKISFDQRHQYILPKRDCLTERLIEYYHKKYLHTGSYLVEALLRQKFWILGGRSLIKKQIRSCNKCFRTNPRSIEPLMADLPDQRVNPAKAFLKTGVDYFGPISITLGRRRGAKVLKAYVALFVCMAVKAIHLEMVSSLSTEHFLQALKRFLSRRGPCEVLYSDRGTNFVGAQKVLSNLSALVRSEEYHQRIERELAEQGIKWKFNPARAPHMGGLWESQIKVVKRHLLRVIGDQLLTYEELNTVLVQVEALLNSRPLCQLSTDPSAPSALTPAHFLYSAPLNSLPAEELIEVPRNRLNRFQLLDQIIQSFWKRWHLEYLTTLQTRRKWDRKTEPLQIGTVVILRVENSPPLKWPLGVVTAVFPGRDGTVRSVRLKCGNKELIRPVVKLCPLPTQ